MEKCEIIHLKAKKLSIRIINALIYDEGILVSVCLERRNPEVSLTTRVPSSGVSYGQKAMKFVVLILHDSLNRELLGACSWSWYSLSF